MITGRPEAFDARAIQSREPRKNSGSATIEIAAAPPRSYSPAIDSMSKVSAPAPLVMFV
jgi:hypothetical protein